MSNYAQVFESLAESNYWRNLYMRQRRDLQIRFSGVSRHEAGFLTRPIGKAKFTKSEKADMKRRKKRAQNVVAVLLGARTPKLTKIETGIRTRMLLHLQVLVSHYHVLKKEEKHHSDIMISLVRQLPVCAFLTKIPGIKEQSVANMLAETRELDGYKKPSLIFKRMGLACMEDGTRQGSFITGMSKAQKKKRAIHHGYCNRRRTVMWKVGTGMVMGARRKLNKYTTIYYDEKERQRKENPDMSDGQVNLRGRRKMEQALLIDAWLNWK